MQLLLEKIWKTDNSNGGSLKHWVGGLMHITVQTCCDLQYLTMRLSGYINATTEPVFLAIRHGMEYIMHHPHLSIIYSKRKIYKTHEIPHKRYFKAGDSEISKN